MNTLAVVLAAVTLVVISFIVREMRAAERAYHVRRRDELQAHLDELMPLLDLQARVDELLAEARREYEEL